MDPKEVEAATKACIVSRKGGVPLEEINDEYRKIIGDSIPFWDLGYDELEDFIKSIESITIEKNQFGESILNTSEDKMSHISQLVNAQRSPHHVRSCEFRARRPHQNTRKQREKSKWYWRKNIRNEELKNSRSQNHRQYRNERRWQNLDARRNCPNRYSRVWGFSGSSEEDNNNYSNSPPPTINRFSKTKVACEPITFTGSQLIGDDFMLQLAMKTLQAPCWKPTVKSAIRCGLCVSGQTIEECRRKLSEIDPDSLHNQIVILLGAVDVYQGKSANRMIRGMIDLLELCERKFQLPRSAISLCTIPPLANLSHSLQMRKIIEQYSFNNWIKFITSEKRYKLVDLFAAFTDENCRTHHNYFELGPRLVSGCVHPHVLWNAEGRKIAIQMINEDPAVSESWD